MKKIANKHGVVLFPVVSKMEHTAQRIVKAEGILFSALNIGDSFHIGKSMGSGIKSNVEMWEEFEKISDSQAKCIVAPGYDNDRMVGTIKRFAANQLVWPTCQESLQVARRIVIAEPDSTKVDQFGNTELLVIDDATREIIQKMTEEDLDTVLTTAQMVMYRKGCRKFVIRKKASINKQAMAEDDVLNLIKDVQDEDQMDRYSKITDTINADFPQWVVDAYNKHASLTYLEDITDKIIADMGWTLTPIERANFKTVVYTAGHVARDEGRKQEGWIEFNINTIQQYVGQTVEFKSEGLLGESVVVGKIIESEGNYFFIKARARSRGIVLREGSYFRPVQSKAGRLINKKADSMQEGNASVTKWLLKSEIEDDEEVKQILSLNGATRQQKEKYIEERVAEMLWDMPNDKADMKQASWETPEPDWKDIAAILDDYERDQEINSQE